MELKQELIERDYSKLSKKYWRNQNLCWYLHDVIMSIFVEVIEDDLMDTEVNFKDEYDILQFEKTEDVYEWLKGTKRDEDFTKILCKNLSHRLLGDFLNYIYESLSNLERGKLTIACDLLRKPFKDNLFYLEWILFNDDEISNLVYNGDIEKYATAGKKGVSKEYIKNIIAYNVKNNGFIKNFESHEFEESIYNIRYNYNSLNSLELIWNKATHLVTTRNQIKSQDFNFIYYDSDDFDNYYEYLYGKIPLLLLYSLGIVENIFDKYFRRISEGNKFYNYSLIISKYIGNITKSYKSTESLLNIIDDSLCLPCEECNEIVKLKNPDKYIFYDYWNIICPKCKEKINICRYFFIDKYCNL